MTNTKPVEIPERKLDRTVRVIGMRYWAYPERITTEDADAIAPVLPLLAAVEEQITAINAALCAAGFTHRFELRDFSTYVEPRPDDAATVAELDAVLAEYDGGHTVAITLNNPHSYRGSYDCFGFTAEARPSTVREMRAFFDDCPGEYCGWKGGAFQLTFETYAYLAEEGVWPGVPFSVALLRKYLGEG